jgi:hypothetical protein
MKSNTSWPRLTAANDFVWIGGPGEGFGVTRAIILSAAGMTRQPLQQQPIQLATRGNKTFMNVARSHSPRFVGKCPKMHLDKRS